MLRLCPPITTFPLEIVEFSFEIAPKISLNDTLEAVILYMSTATSTSKV